ncbi:MAG: hypothetical protein JRF24_07955 [Deltaproteobacteria bacterium]|nr:hypothetical protein [Deltaproteobacteria bacterium]
MRNLRYYAPGITLILIAILIVAVPEILVAFVVGLIVMAGIGALYIGHMIRRSSIESDGGGLMIGSMVGGMRGDLCFEGGFGSFNTGVIGVKA